MILKLTRKAFNRKLLAFFATALLSVSLSTTGFVSFIVSTNAETTSTGNVEVGGIAEGRMEFFNLQISGDGNILFEPLEDDNTGRVRNDGKNFENLRVTVTGRLRHAEYMDSIKIHLELPESVYRAEEEGFIVLPTIAKEELEVKNVSVPSAAGDVSFSYTFEFQWGEKFHGMNPSVFFDTQLGLDTYDDLQMEEMLKDLRRYVYGDEFAEVDFADLPEEVYTYKIVLIAYVN